MIRPPSLTSGDKVGIIATARRVTPEDVEKAVIVLQRWGLKPVLSPYLFSQDHSYLAGSDSQRSSALQQFMDDPSIHAIFCARGGYGTTRILDDIDLSEFRKQPKWIVGFSDITALHLRISAAGFQSIHGTMPILFSKFDSESSVNSLHNALFDEVLELSAGPDDKNKPGVATGILTGGNLSLLTDSLGTKDEVETEGKILIVEEVDEYLYKIDRMLVQLKRAGKLDHLAGLIVGHFSEIRDTDLQFGESVAEIVGTHTRKYNYPVAFGFPVGHQNPNLAWISGGLARLDVNEFGSTLKHSR